MRILMISDIHANLPALLTLESEIEVADLTLVGGDLIGYYCDVNEVIAFVIRHGLTCVRGNHD
jgi:predicted phosphodiesterase